MSKVNLGRVVGKSAYELWLDEGNTGTLQDYIASLKGEPGDVNTAQMNTAIADAIAPVTSQLSEITNLDVVWTTGGYYGTNGVFRTSAAFKYTGYIKCGIMREIEALSVTQVCAYDETRKFIGVVTGAITGYPYITVNADKDAAPIVRLKRVITSGLTGQVFNDGSITRLKIDGARQDPYSNMVDPSTFTQGYYVHGRNDGAGGLVIASADYWATPIIKIDPTKSYTFKGFHPRNYAFYDSNFAFVPNGETTTEPVLPDPFTPPSAAAWVRVSAESDKMEKASTRDIMVIAESPIMRKSKMDYLPISVEAISAVQNPVHHIGREFSTFNKCLCIGDSLTDGAFDLGTEFPTISQYSYPMQLKKISGVDCTNMGASGITSVGWYSTYGGNDLSGHDCCIILLGTNDMYQDISDADTETALRAIIAKVKQDNPGIRIFISTLLKSYATSALIDLYDAKNAVIRAIASDTAGVYLMDSAVYSECWRNSPYATGHQTAIGYNKLASEFAAYIGYIILHNPTDFQNVQFIGTVNAVQ